MPWRTAVVLSILLALTWIVLRLLQRAGAPRQIAGEAALVLGLYAAWQYIGAINPWGMDSAIDTGRWIADVQQALHWPSEAWLQSLVIGHDGVIAFADWYYTALHIPVFVITLIWVLLRHRPDWPFVRTTTILMTGACLVIQFKAVAPPRLVPDLDIVDTALVNGRSVYAAIPGANEFAAMPSVHVAWAAAVALFVIVAARTPWRWLVLAYPVLTFAVVVVTGNHFILDGVVSLALLAGAAGLTLVIPGQAPRLCREGRGDAGVSGVGGAEGTRTPDPLVANEVRYQLRYSPLRCPHRVASRSAIADREGRGPTGPTR